VGDKLTKILLLVVTLCSVTVTALVLRREVASRAVRDGDHLPRRIKDWRSLASRGHRIGSASAAVTIVEFSDFQCPFCARFYQMFESLRHAYGDSLALVYRHLPLQQHQYAFVAAVAAECAARQGRFEQMYHALFDAQESLGTQPMVGYAIAAGVSDTASFSASLKTDEVAQVVERDREEIQHLGARGTPTLFINGETVRGTPSELDLRRLISSHLSDSR
jgi:protein-disulfide isomerase